MHTRLLLTLLLFCAAFGQAEDKPSSLMQEDISLNAYLEGLGRITPAARDGAHAYLDAFRRRCGRPLKVIELRQAVADDTGDPVLMAMIRAAFQNDTAALQRLSGSVSCARGN